VGEHVAWTVAEHERLGAALPALAPLGRWRLGAWAAEVARRTAAPHARAALEAAAIDLALRQRGTSLFALAGAPPRPVRYVVSFGRSADPAAEARRLAGAADHVEWKIDADPRWDDAVYHALADLGSVAVLDFKGAGSAADHARAHHALPEALLEDPDPAAAPWTASLRARLGADAPVVSAAAVATLPVRPAAVNVKPARMGGVLEALACLAVCAEAGIAAYLGGMWEVGPGRRQLQALAALLAPDGPNDVAPLATTTAPAARPARLAVDATAPGFGAERR
jgi:L-alanine-DL-glutamate epimerase-like enolase superfamily enzyme